MIMQMGVVDVTGDLCDFSVSAMNPLRYLNLLVIVVSYRNLSSE